MATLKTYDLRGEKLSFANWISNLSPVDTPFTSMINKESVDQTRYSWQIDRLSAPMNPGFEEGSNFVAGVRPATQVMSNFTQILRKVVKVTDTANKIGLYGRASEKAYQMEKAGKELRRDLEWAVLHNGPGKPGASDTAREMGGFASMVAALDQKDLDTGAVVHKSYKAATANDPAFTEAAIFDLTYNLYLAGAKADKVMVHPKHMILFSNFINKNESGSQRLFKNLDDKFNSYVKSFRDPLGQTFTVIPNRFMPENKVFFFNENDWTQMILRAPETRELARVGSAEKHMMEMEVGLRHRNPFASGVLELGVGDKLSLTARLTHDVINVNGTTKVMVQAMKNGVEDNTLDGALTVTMNPAQGITMVSTSPTLSGGKTDIEFSAQGAGSYLITVKHTNGTEATVELQVQSTRSAVEPVEAEAEVVEAPKARKARAKAE